MASKRQQKNRAKRNAQSVGRERVPAQLKRKRPTPVQAVESRHLAQAEWLGRRPDRFSQLLAKSIADEHAGQHLVTRSGLTAEERAEMAALREEAHAAFGAELAAATSALRELLKAADPLYSVALIQATNLMTTWGSYYEPTHEGGENRVELVAGLLASQPPNNCDRRATDAPMQPIFDEVDHVLELLYLFNFSMEHDNDVDTAALRFMGAMHWMNIRGSSFADHGKELARAVFSPYDLWLLETYGFTVDDLISIGEAVEALTHQSLNALLDQARVFADGVLAQLEDPASRAQLVPSIRANTATADQRGAAARFAFMDVFQSGIREAVTFTVEDLCAVAPELDQARVASALGELSLELGSVDSSDYTGLFDPSPLVERPFLRHTDRYILPVPGMLLRDTFRVLDARLMRQRSGYSKVRAKTLDRLAVGWLASMLPGALAYTNLHYGDDELDGLVLFEDVALVVEGKGSSISFQAQRGDVRRLVNEIRESAQRALEQGVRARDFILAPGDSVFFDERGNELVRVSEGAVRVVQIVNPTIHELAGFAPQLARFRSRGLFVDAELPWSVYVNDLRVIAETCESAAVFLHYLVWRGRLPLGEQVIVHDELDLWGAYLFGARFPPLEGEGIHHVGNSTTDFDAYYDGAQGRGPKRGKPRKFLQEPVVAFVNRMTADRPSGWLDAAGVCLDLSVPELGFVCLKALDAARVATAHGSFAEFSFGRGVLIGVPRDARTAAVVKHAERKRTDTSFAVYVRQVSAKRAELVWAAYGATIDLELSELEKQVFDAPETSAFQS